MAINKYFSEKPVKQEKHNVNTYIKSSQVRLIDENGQNIGIVATKDALSKAKLAQLDLVEVSHGNPPVCKIMNYGKFLYEQAKSQKHASKAAKHDDKEIQLRPSIGFHDLEIKARKAKEFLEEGRKVNVIFKLQGREKQHLEILRDVINKFYNLVKDVSKLETRGENYILIPNC